MRPIVPIAVDVIHTLKRLGPCTVKELRPLHENLKDGDLSHMVRRQLLTCARDPGEAHQSRAAATVGDRRMNPHLDRCHFGDCIAEATATNATLNRP